ncbi:MAG: hypothetical protein Q9164_002329, partial [Protoblastenia rupestris]
MSSALVINSGQVPSRSATNRYNLDPRSDSPQKSATPPKSPNKPLPIAPDPAARIASSQKYIKPSRSTNSSPYANQSTTAPIKPALEKETTLQVRHNAALSPKSPDQTRSARTPTPDNSVRIQGPDNQTRSPKLGLGISRRLTPEPHRSARSPEPPRPIVSPEPPRSIRSLEPQRYLETSKSQQSMRSPRSQISMRSPEPHLLLRSPGPQRAESPESAMPFKTPAQIMARMPDASKPSVPERSLSRRRSLTERTRSILGRKPSVKTTNESGRSPADVPIQSPTDGSEDKDQASPTMLRRLSSRRKNQTMSMSTYSASPTASDKPDITSETPPRQASPQYTQNGRAVPTQSSYRTLSLLPTQPEFSPLQSSFSEADLEQKTDSPTKLSTQQTAKLPMPQLAPLPKPKNVPDDSEGSVNNAHPLLQEARHARFATRTAPGTPGSKSSQDLPLRHYSSHTQFTHSNPDLTQHKQDGYRPPKRSSSLLYTPGNRYALPFTTQRKSTVQEPPTQDQSTPNASALNLLNRTTTLPPENELGIHPAHRTPEPPSATTTSPSPDPSMSSSATEHGATPPPISTIRSPQTTSPPPGFSPTSPSRSPLQQPTEDQFPAQSIHAAQPPQSSGNLQTPFYLNPASSSALVEFLATTPPPSPPRPGSNTEPGTPTTASTSNFFNNRTLLSRSNDNASPTPPPPGGARMAPWSKNDSTPNINGGGSGTQKKTSGWKKVFGGSKNVKEKREKGSRKGTIAWRKNNNT